MEGVGRDGEKTRPDQASAPPLPHRPQSPRRTRQCGSHAAAAAPQPTHAATVSAWTDGAAQRVTPKWSGGGLGGEGREGRFRGHSCDNGPSGGRVTPRHTDKDTKRVRNDTAAQSQNDSRRMGGGWVH